MGIYSKGNTGFRNKNIKITRSSLLRNLLFLQVLIVITIILIMNGPFVYIGIPILLVTVIFYIGFMTHWKAFQYSPKIIHIITCLTVLISILLSGVITNAITGVIGFLFHI